LTSPVRVTVPKGLRVRYLVREPKTAAWVATNDAGTKGAWVMAGGDWRRVWSRAWHQFRGAKKIVAGKTVLIEIEPMPGWG